MNGLYIERWECNICINPCAIEVTRQLTENGCCLKYLKGDFECVLGVRKDQLFEISQLRVQKDEEND
jgi:hypothetical protein